MYTFSIFRGILTKEKISVSDKRVTIDQLIKYIKKLTRQTSLDYLVLEMFQ